MPVPKHPKQRRRLHNGRTAVRVFGAEDPRARPASLAHNMAKRFAEQTVLRHPTNLFQIYLQTSQPVEAWRIPRRIVVARRLRPCRPLNDLSVQNRHHTVAAEGVPLGVMYG
jgi:hypothetical protein